MRSLSHIVLALSLFTLQLLPYVFCDVKSSEEQLYAIKTLFNPKYTQAISSQYANQTHTLDISFQSPLESNELKQICSQCTVSQTCCRLGSTTYGCCEYRNAVCCTDVQGCCERGEICCGQYCCINGAQCSGGRCQLPDACPPGYKDCLNDYCCETGSICCGQYCCINGAQCSGGRCQLPDACPPGYKDCLNDYCCETGSICCGQYCCINGAQCHGGTCQRPSSPNAGVSIAGLMQWILITSIMWIIF